MKKLFSIGEISKIFNISVATLRYYDAIDLFKPIQTDPHSGYRYYSIDQFEELSKIRYLRLMGVSLKETKNICEKMTPENYLLLLKKQHEKAVQEYNRLQTVINKFTHRINEIEEARRCKDLDVIRIEHLQERKVLRLHERIASRSELELAIRKLEKMANAYLEKVGLTISCMDLSRHYFKDYNSIFVMPEDSQEDTKMNSTLPAGDYVCIYYRGKHDESPPYYEKLLNYLKENNYAACGDPVRFIIIDRTFTENRKMYLAEIQIPVEKII
ncbi:MAG: MerR family transcriptional regulator [Bacillota bacterium]|nr:MerR family transcriptional regulator [Bacillota bacterium]